MNALQPTLPGFGMNISVAVLKIDGLDLMFRQSDVRALESASYVDANNPWEGSIGWIAYMRQRWPVYSLSDQLELSDDVPPSRRTCALLAIETGYFGMLCDDVSIVTQAAWQTHEVPVAMKNASTPILGLIHAGDKLMCASNPNLMAEYIEHMVCKPSLPKGLPCLA
jgi:hypothetical protein